MLDAVPHAYFSFLRQWSSFEQNKEPVCGTSANFTLKAQALQVLEGTRGSTPNCIGQSKDSKRPVAD
jgi:hypothetical protein